MIRPATIKDIPFCIKVARKFCELAGVKYNKESLTNTLTQVIESDDGILIRSDNGLIAGLMANHFISGERYSQELAWWSTGNDGKQLLNAFEKESINRGAEFIIMISLNNDYQSKIDSIYKSRGYESLEHTFIKRVK